MHASRRFSRRDRLATGAARPLPGQARLLRAADAGASPLRIALPPDYAAGRENIGDFIDTFRKQDGSMGESLRTPLGNTDFASLIHGSCSAYPGNPFQFNETHYHE